VSVNLYVRFGIRNRSLLRSYASLNRRASIDRTLLRSCWSCCGDIASNLFSIEPLATLTVLRFRLAKQAVQFHEPQSHYALFQRPRKAASQATNKMMIACKITTQSLDTWSVKMSMNRPDRISAPNRIAAINTPAG